MEFAKIKIIQSSWYTLKDHLGLWILIILFILCLNILLTTIQDMLLTDIDIQSILFTLSAILFQAGINLGVLRIALDINKNNKVGFNQIFGSFHILVPYILATVVLLGIILVAASPGIILLLISISELELLNSMNTIIPVLLIIIPTIYTSIRLQFYDYFLIDEECGVLDSIKKSLDATKECVGELFILGVILSIIILISIIPLGAGLIIGIPIVIMVNTHVYLILKNRR